MKHRMVKGFLVCAIFALVLLGCKAKNGDDGSFKPEPLSKKGSYALGVDLGSYMKSDNMLVDIAEFRGGVTDVINEKEMRLTFEDIGNILNAELGTSGEVGQLSADASYAWGVSIGMEMRRNGMNPNMGEFLKGLTAVLDDKKPRYTAEKAREILDAEFAALQKKEMQRMEKEMEKRAAENEKLRQAEVEFLVENSKKPGIITTASGLQYEVITEGKGTTKPGPESTVMVHYEGTLADGTVFDSSYERGEPMEFELNFVVPGWSEGLQLMSEGAVYMLYIPSELGYGEQGSWTIPPYAPLTFKVELLSVAK